MKENSDGEMVFKMILWQSEILQLEMLILNINVCYIQKQIIISYTVLYIISLCFSGMS